MVAAEAVASTVVAGAAASTVVAVSAGAAASTVAELDRVSEEADGPLGPAVFAVAHLALMARTVRAGREPTAIDLTAMDLTAIDLTVRGLMGCTVEGARLHLVHVTGRRRGTELTQG